MRSDQDLLAEYRKNGETTQAANFLRHLIERDRGQVRRYPDPKSKAKGKSGDWQITRSLAMRAICDGSNDGHALLALHIRDAFQEREEGDSIEARKQRAIEVFDACLDAARNVDVGEYRNHFRLADAAAEYAIHIIEKYGRFPTKEETLRVSSDRTGLQIGPPQEGTRILSSAHLSFLPKEKPQRGTTGHSMKEGFRMPVK
jgi:hypothetical protein